MTGKPEQQSQGRAKKKAADDGEVKRGVLAAMHDVAGEPAEAEWELIAKIKKRANDNQ